MKHETGQSNTHIFTALDRDHRWCRGSSSGLEQRVCGFDSTWISFFFFSLLRTGSRKHVTCNMQHVKVAQCQGQWVLPARPALPKTKNKKHETCNRLSLGLHKHETGNIKQANQVHTFSLLLTGITAAGVGVAVQT